MYGEREGKTQLLVAAMIFKLDFEHLVLFVLGVEVEIEVEVVNGVVTSICRDNGRRDCTFNLPTCVGLHSCKP